MSIAGPARTDTLPERTGDKPERLMASAVSSTR